MPASLPPRRALSERLASFRRPALAWRRAVLLALGVVLASSLAAVPAWAQREAAPPEAAYAEAVRHYQSRLYEQAAAALAAFRRAHPSHPDAAEALFLEAKALLALDRQVQAVRRFQTLEARYPSHPRAAEAQLSLGQYFFASGEPARGRALLEEVAREASSEDVAARALYQLGTAEQAQGRTQAALAAFERVEQAYPTSEVAPAALYAAGAAHVRLERYDAAADAFARLGSRYASSPYAQNLGLALADVYYELGQYTRTVNEVKRRLPGLESETARERAYFLLGESYNQLRDNENAIIYYRRLIEQHPASPYVRPARYGLAWNYHFEGAHQWAADAFAAVRRDDAPAGGADVRDAAETADLLARALYYEGVNRYLEGRPRQALEAYEQFVAQHPDHELADQAQYEIGAIHYQQRRWREANAAFERVVTRYRRSPRRGDALYYLGNTDIALNDFDRALARFDEAIALDAAPDSLRDALLFQKAWLLYDQGQYADAAPAFERIVARGTSHRTPDARFWAAESRYQLAQYVRAEDGFRTYLDAQPDGTHANAAVYALGWTHFRRQRYDDAATYFQRFLDRYGAAARTDDDATARVPYRQDARLRLGDSYYALQRYNAAIQAYRKVDEDAGGADYALYQIGQAQNLAQRPDQALATFRTLLTRYEDSSWREEARYGIGYLLFQQQDYEAAVAAYRALVEAAPQDPLAAKAQYGIGDAYFNAGDYDAALRAYQAVLDRYPQSPFAGDAASGLQYVLLAQDDPDRAQAVIDSLTTANPDSPVAAELRFRQAEATYQSGQVDEALQSFRRFVRTSSDETLLPEAYYYLGTIHADRDELDAAEGYLKQVVESYPGSDRRAEAALRLGDIARTRDRADEAARYYRLVLELDGVEAGLAAQARYGQALTLMRRGETTRAERLLTGMLDADAATQAPELARLGLGRLYERLERPDDAAEQYRLAVREARGEAGAEALYRLGALLLAQDQPEDALRELGRMPALFGGYAEWMARGYLVQARAHRVLGERGEAARLYERVERDYAGTPFAATAARERAAL